MSVGDYNKLIVACTVKGAVKEELETKVQELRLGISAYQSQELVISIEPNEWPYDCDTGNLNVVLVGQTKSGMRQQDFCEWLKPYVVQGSGENDVYAMSFNEYSDIPQVWKLSGQEEPPAAGED